MADWNGDSVNDRWPLFYDNYFVPRGYAYVLAQMNGTGYTENGCPMHGGPGDIAGEKSVVDWLNGRVKAYALKAGTPRRPTSEEVVADWHNGSSAMIGKSYDGTLSNGVAATGVEGLKTIVPVSRDLRLVQLLAHRRRPSQHELPGRQPEPDGHHGGGTDNPPRRRTSPITDRRTTPCGAGQRGHQQRRQRRHRRR